MRDREMVAAIVAGNPAGLAAAYAEYAPSLYAYCCSRLTEPADAADAVQDTFIIAASRLVRLRDPERLRPWLYAVARNECAHRLRARSSSAALAEAGDVLDETVDFGVLTEQAELRDLVRAALAGLNPGDGEVIELNLRHELDGTDLADVLGVPRNQAHALASRARAQLEASLGALLVARRGRQECAELASLLDGWDGQLTVLLRKRINRHIEHCDMCGVRKRRELSPAMLLSMLPLAMLPDGLRQQMLRAVADLRPAAVTHRGVVVMRAGSLQGSGFPVQLARPAPVHGPVVRALRVSGAGVACAAAVAGALVLVRQTPPGPATGIPVPGGTSPVILTSPTMPAHPGGSSSPAFGGPIPGRQIVAAAPGAPPVLVTPPRASSPGGTAPSGSASQAPTSAATAPASTSASASSSASASAGTLSASPLSLSLSLSLTATFTLTAEGGPVSNYRISVPAVLSATPSSGSLAAGASVRVTVHVAVGASLLSPVTLTVNPGGILVTIAPAIG